jgi:hypothetical protein
MTALCAILKHNLAHAVQSGLKRVAEVTVWDQDVFRLSRPALESLVKSVKAADFAIFVFAPDDKLTMRGTQLDTARDNVIYELGLFSGWLGYQRCFLLRPQGATKLRIPSDLLGITFTEYESDRGDQDLAAPVGPAVEAITRAIDEMGFFSVDDPLFDGDPTLRNAPALIVNRDLAGIWLSCFTYRVFRNGDLVDGQQFDLEYLAAHGSRSLRGRNVLVESDGGKEYRHELRLTIVRDHILGRWFNVNSQNFGAFQLQVHNLRLLMTGQHLGNANDNSVQLGEWKWLRVDLGRLTVADALSRLTRARLRPLKELEIIMEEHISRDKAVPLSDILARNGKKSSI